MSELIEALRTAVKSMIKPDLIIGKVKKFNSSDWTIDVELLSGTKIESCTIKAVLNGESTGIFVKPIINSNVLLGLTNGKLENLTVLVYSEIEEIRFLPAQSMQLKGDTHGGLVKIQQLQSNLDAIKNYLAAEKMAISSAFTAVGVSTAASGPSGAASFNASMASQVITFQNMENQNVKHG